MKSNHPKQDVIPSYCYGTLARNADLNTILESVKQWGQLPAGWSMSICESSVHLRNANRTRLLKIDVYRTVYSDAIRSDGTCTSFKQQAKNMEAALTLAKDIFTRFTKKHESKIKSKSSQAEVAQTTTC